MSDDTWRVGEHYSIHVYRGDWPIATFHNPVDAAAAVKAHNDALTAQIEIPNLIAQLNAAGAWYSSKNGAALAAVERVKVLHELAAPSGTWCRQCGSTWPCRTIKALEPS